MLVKQVALMGFRGQSRSVAFDKSLVLLKGPVGAGKTSILMALTMLCGLPTSLGSRGYGFLSPSGAWEISMISANAGSSFVWRYEERAGSSFLAGPTGHEAPVKADRFWTNVRRGIDLEPFHVDLSAFAELSGAKRASLFAAILSGDVVTSQQAVESAVGCPLDDLVTKVAGDDRGSFDASGVAHLAALPGPLATMVSEWQNKNVAAEREARRAASEAARDQTSAPADPDALRKSLSTIDEGIGQATADIENIGRISTAYGAMKSQVTDQEKKVNELAGILKDAGVLRNDLVRMEQELSTMDAVAAKRPPSDIPTIEQASGMIGATTIPEANAQDKGSWDSGYTMAMSVAQACLLDMKHKEMERQRAPSTTAIEDQRKTIEKVRATVAKIPELELTHKAASDRLVELRRAHQEMTIPGDVELYNARRDQLKEDRRSVTAQIAMAEQAKAALGKGEEAAVKAAELLVQVKVGKAILDAVCSFRDAQTSVRIQKVTRPMREKLSEMMGREVPVEFRIIGEGKSQQVDVLVKLKDSPVRFQDLSGGEAVLVAAVFLSTLQHMKEGPGKMLMLEADALDAPSMRTFLDKAPALGMDMIFVATNKDVDGGGSWQTISM